MESQVPSNGSTTINDLQNQEQLEQMIAEDKFMNITIIDLNGREINLKMVQYEMVLELREFLNEHVYTCFFTHYYFEHAGQKVNDYTELATLNLAEDPKIFMRPEKYDEKSARNHIKRVKDILASPPVLSTEQKEQTLPSVTKESQEESKEAQPVQAEAVEDQKQVDQMEEKLKKNYEDFLSIIEKESKKDVPLPQKNGASASHLLREMFRNPIEAEMNKVQHLKCVESISFSTSFNPVPPYRRLAGDLFYLVVKTLDAGDISITCSVNGFYRNDSVEKQNFSPAPSATRNPAYSYTLIGCLYQVSQAFGKNLEAYINSILHTEPYFLTQPPLPVYKWIEQDTKLNQSKNALKDDSQSNTLIPLYGLDPKGIRDWNEEFQVVKDFPKETFTQRLQRDRAVQKVYNDFLDAAVKGSIAIVNGNLMPLNPNESDKQQVFVYNYIFFSYAIDLIDSFKDLTASDNNPSFTQANHDIMGLRALQILDIEGLHILATCIVNYKGHRVIAQSIIPGILNNNDLTSLAEYGSVDEQKTIYASESFHKLMTKVCETLNIKVNKVIDGSGKEVEIAGSTEVKGIKGTDKRNYLVDLQGLTPRDANYEGEDFHTCLLRPELLMIYQRTKNIEYATAKMQEFNKQLEEEKKSQEPSKKFEEMNEKEREEHSNKLRDENLRKLREFDKFIKEAPKFVFNTNVLKNVQFAMDKTEIEKDEQLVRDLALFLNDQAIPKLIKDLQNVEGVPTDSESLEQAFHSHGINMRYLGAVSKHEQLRDKELNHLKTLLEKEVVFRSVKHIFNEHLRECPDTYLSALIAHMFNILLAPFPFIDQMNEGKLSFVDQTIQSIIKQIKNEKSSKEESKVEESQQVTEPSQVSKTEKKKQKKKAKQVQNAQEASVEGSSKENKKKEKKQKDESKGPKDIAEMLFRQNMDLQPFKVDDLFKESQVANSLFEIEKPDGLNLKPIDLYNRIKEIAAKRFRFTLPEKQQDLKCLHSPNNKLSLLRDICLKVGIKVLCHSERDYILENDSAVLASKLQNIGGSADQSKSSKTASKKKQQQQIQEPKPQVSLEPLLTYENLPFKSSDIIELFPVIKHLDLQNPDIKQLLASAKQSYKDGYFEKAFELYSQCINSLLQITGPMNKEVAGCISKLASIQYKFGDFLQAIELQTKSIILQERLMSYDHPQCAYSYSNLALYYHTCGYFTKAFEYMYRSLNILKVSAGENHPDISSMYLNLGLMYQDFEHFQAAIDCFHESLYRNINLFGEKHIQVASCYQAIAHAYFQLNDYRKALDFQEKAHKIIVEILPADDQYIKSSKAQMDQFMKLSVYMEKIKNQEKQARPIGANKPTAQTKQAQAAAQAAAVQSQQQEAAARRSMKMSSLFSSRMQNPRNKNFLDVLEYNYIREQQLMAQKLLKEQFEQAEKAEAEKKSEESEKKE